MKRILAFNISSFLASTSDTTNMPSVADILPSQLDAPTRKPSVPPPAAAPVISNGRSNGHSNGHANGHARPETVFNDGSSRPAMYAKFIESYEALTSFRYANFGLFLGVRENSL